MKGRSRRQPVKKTAGNRMKNVGLVCAGIMGLCVILLFLYQVLPGMGESRRGERSRTGKEGTETVRGADLTKEFQRGDPPGTDRESDEGEELSDRKSKESGEKDRPTEWLFDDRSETAEAKRPLEQEEIRMYRDFLERMEMVKSIREMGDQGFTVIEEQVFPFEMEGRKEVFLVPAMDRESRRLALFFVGAEEEIVFRTERLEANQQIPGSFKQGNRGVAAVSFPDLDGDGLNDVVLIVLCNTREDGTGMTCKVGDVLFQAQGGFYQDWRLSDRINRFGMNKSVKMILSFVKEGDSADAFYRAATLEELKEHGFMADEEHAFRQNFEKLGELLVVPGYYRMAEYHICMVCLVNPQGNLVWSDQPMGEFENLYELLEIDSRDIDGDGLKDLTVLARYTYDAPDGSMMTEKDYTIYYQRTGGFLEDTELKSRYQCREETTMEELVELARAYWGWGTEND